jgi:thiosulfate dehydrogenase
MRNFLTGFVIAAILAALAAFCFVRLGWLDPRADIPVSALESKIAMPSLDAAVDRRAPEAKSPIPSSDENLIAGMKVYQANCAVCHGDVMHPRASLANSLYPRAPQFLEDAPDMPENQNFYIIQHGIRWSGMPGWKQSLSETEIWQVTTFLSQMDKLPATVNESWKAAAASPVTNSQPANVQPVPAKGTEPMPMH